VWQNGTDEVNRAEDVSLRTPHEALGSVGTLALSFYFFSLNFLVFCFRLLFFV
jgi:hypothetical protein